MPSYPPSVDATAFVAPTAQLDVQPPDGPPTYVARVGHFAVLHAGSRVLASAGAITKVIL